MSRLKKLYDASKRLGAVLGHLAIMFFAWAAKKMRAAIIVLGVALWKAGTWTVKTSWQHKKKLSRGVIVLLAFLVGWKIGDFLTFVARTVRSQASANPFATVIIEIAILVLMIGGGLLSIKWLYPFFMRNAKDYGDNRPKGEAHEQPEESSGHSDGQDGKDEHVRGAKRKASSFLFTMFKWALGTIFLMLAGFFLFLAIQGKGWDAFAASIGFAPEQKSAVRFGGNWCDTNQWDYLHRNVSKVVIHPTMGCYAGNVRLQPNWGQVKIEKSQNPGDEVRIWCAGKSKPSRTYFGYEQNFEQTDIDSCYLNGRDTSMTFRVQGTPGSSITIRPVTLIQGVPMPPPEKEADN